MRTLTVLICEGCGHQFNKDTDKDIFNKCDASTCNIEICKECERDCTDCYDKFCEDHIHDSGLCKNCEFKGGIA